MDIKRFAPIAALTLLAALTVAASVHAANGHSHGVGALEVSIENTQIAIDLELPLDSVTGFEHAPKNDKEKAALTEAERLLKDAAAMFVPTPEAGCTATSVKVSVPYADGKTASGDGHVDIDASYVFRCANPATLKGIETRLFKHFKRLYRIEARWIGPSGQGAARLSAKQPTLSW